MMTSTSLWRKHSGIPQARNPGWRVPQTAPSDHQCRTPAPSVGFRPSPPTVN
jgi:hypothetical protein